MPKVSVASEGIKFKEHNGPECVNTKQSNFRKLSTPINPNEMNF